MRTSVGLVNDGKFVVQKADHGAVSGVLNETLDQLKVDARRVVGGGLVCVCRVYCFLYT